MYQTCRKIIDFPLQVKALPLSLFNSQGYFWLVSAISCAFAAEELEQSVRKSNRFRDLVIDPHPSKPLVDIFKDSLQKGQVSDQAKKIAQDAALDNLKLLKKFMQTHCCFFNIESSLILGKTFFAYWLIYKIIELEWQEVLDQEMVQENYLLLDAFIEDSYELEEVEGNFLDGGELTLDDKLYLRGHRERAMVFWTKTYQDLELLKGHWVSFHSPWFMP